MLKSVVKEKSKLEVGFDAEAVYNKLISELDGKKGWERVFSDKLSKKIRYKISFSFKSWGETVEVCISQINQNSSLVEIISYPILFTTLFDYGKNRHNINFVKEVLGISY